ncbi:MAG TPA: sodium:solute symporter [Firmicutes bacterium]|nr:sodium:solute symporter [Bacillota bacterium]
MDNLVYWVSIGLFLLLLVGIGFFTMGRNRTTADFFLGGRNIGPWISAFAYGTTYFSAVIFIGYAGGLGFTFGLPVVWIAIGNTVVGSFLAWLTLGKRTRALTSRLNVMTMPEFLEARYQSRTFKVLSALVVFFFLIPYSGSVFSGLSFLFVNILNISYHHALAFMTIITAIYLLLGGYTAVSLSDFIQGLIMLVGSVLMVFYIITHPAVGGGAGLVRGLQKIDPNLAQAFPSGGMSLLWLVILTSLGAWGLPQMVQKFYAIKNEKVIFTAMVVGTAFCLIVAGAAYLTGSTASLYGTELIKENDLLFQEHPQYNAALIDPGTAKTLLGQAMRNQVYPNTAIIPQILKIALPEMLLVVILLLVLSASMSTLSSLVLVSSSSIVIDLIQGHFSPKLSKGKAVFLMRLFCLVFVVVSLLVAVYGEKWPYLVALMSFSWGTISGAFLAPYLYGLFWKGVTKAGAWAGFLTGLGYSVGSFLYYCVRPELRPLIKDVAPRVGSISMLLPLVVVPVVSWLTPKFSQAHIDKVFPEKGKFATDSQERVLEKKERAVV